MSTNRTKKIIHLVQEGIISSFRSSSEEKVKRISSIVAHGISEVDIDRELAVRFLSLMENYEDRHILVLASRDKTPEKTFAVKSKFSLIVEPRMHVSQEPMDEIFGHEAKDPKQSYEDATTAEHLNFACMSQLMSDGLLEQPNVVDGGEVGGNYSSKPAEPGHITALGKKFLEYIKFEYPEL